MMHPFPFMCTWRANQFPCSLRSRPIPEIYLYSRYIGKVGEQILTDMQTETRNFATSAKYMRKSFIYMNVVDGYLPPR